MNERKKKSNENVHFLSFSLRFYSGHLHKGSKKRAFVLFRNTRSRGRERTSAQVVNTMQTVCFTSNQAQSRTLREGDSTMFFSHSVEEMVSFSLLRRLQMGISRFIVWFPIVSRIERNLSHLSKAAIKPNPCAFNLATKVAGGLPVELAVVFCSRSSPTRSPWSWNLASTSVDPRRSIRSIPITSREGFRLSVTSTLLPILG